MKIVLIILLLMFAACTSKDVNGELNYDFEVEKKIIDFGDTLVSPVFSFYSIEKIANKEIFLHAFLDRFKNIIITDIVEGKFIKKININTNDDPNSVSSGIIGFFPLSDSTYLIESFPSFYIINDHGKVLTSTNIPNKLGEIFGNKYNDNLYISSEMSHSVRINRHEYVLQVYRPNLNVNENYPLYPLFVKLKIDESLNIEISPIDIYFPEEFKLPGGLTFGQHERAAYSIQNNHIIYGFGFSSKVFIYNIKNKTMVSIDLEIKNGINFSPPEATNIILSGNRLLTNFNIPLIDFNTNTIYRFHIDIDEENPMDNQGYLTVFDLDGRKLIESSLGKNSERMLRNPFLLKGHIYMNPYYPRTMEEDLEFYKFNLVKK